MMKRFWAYIKKHPVRFGFLGGLIFLFALLIGIRYVPAVSEFWTTTIGRAYQTVIGFISSFFPFSLFELFIIAVIVYIVLWIVFFVLKTKRNGFKESSIKIVNLFLVIFSVLTLYVGTAGMAYHRYPLKLPLSDIAQVESSKYYDISMWAIDDFNQCTNELEFDQQGSIINPYSGTQLGKIIANEYNKIEGDYLTKFDTKPKDLLIFGWLYTELNITGVSFLPTGEANYNSNVPNADIPFVIAHELAHTKGVMNENEANNLALYVCLNSEDPYLRYSGYSNCFDSLEAMMKTTNNKDKEIYFYTNVDSKIWSDFNYSYNFWKNHTFFREMSDWFNNLYLEIFGSQTTDAYNDHLDDETVIIDNEPVYVLNSLSPYQQIILDCWLKENDH